VEHLTNEVSKLARLAILHKRARALVLRAVPPREVPRARRVIASLLHHSHLFRGEERVAYGLHPELELAKSAAASRAHEDAERRARVLWRASAVARACHALTITFELAKITQDLLVLRVLTRGQGAG
jgi:hypothetical protein